MEVNYQSLLEDMQGNWTCIKGINQITAESIDLEFSLLISENLISRTGHDNQYWPSICGFELVGSIKDSYFYREDGCFMQVKHLTQEELVIELSNKNVDGKVNTFIFSFSKILD
jgi:hypothetical protein